MELWLILGLHFHFSSVFDYISIILSFTFLLICVHVFVWVCHSACLEVRGQLAGVLPGIELG